MIGTINEGKQDFKMIGYLDSRDDLVITAKGSLVARLYPSTDWPESIDITNIPHQMSMIINNNHHIGFTDDESSSDFEQRKDIAFNYLKNKWFITTPSFTYSDLGNRLFLNAFDVETLPQNPGTKASQVWFTRIPQFSVVNEYNRPNNQYQFEDALLKGKIIGDVVPWPTDASEAPRNIIWRKNDVEMFFYVGIEKQEKTTRGFAYFPKDGEKIRRVAITVDDADWLSSLLTLRGEDVTYVPQDIVQKYEKRATAFQPQQVVSTETNIVHKHSDNLATNEKNVIETEITKSSGASTIPIVNSNLNTSKQARFIQRFIRQTVQMGLHYNVKDLITFHTAMESNGLVILSGLSGTGKSKLVSAYAIALGIADQKTSSDRLCFVPVRPFWADDSDLLGYVDTVNSVYRPGDSGLVDTLLSAEKDPNNLYIIVFDEMNLARVEHYFSQFLSVLELSSDSRYIQLYNKQLGNRLYNQKKYPFRIKVGSNVLFVGTVNTDESTFQFSDKVLDRSNVISLHIVPFNQDFSSVQAPESEESMDTMKMSSEDYFNLIDKNNTEPLTSEERSLLWDIHSALNSKDRNLGIGWRIVQQIESFLISLPNIENGVSRGEAFDLQLVQRVLTKVRGSEELLRDLVGNEDDEGILIQIFDKYIGISKFTESRQVIQQKARELKLYGFTM
ncbi:McrB family protein [Lactiplantibacillus paraplantarum]|uniref:McrB family protein n=1 Tax=Lactiplantibacillus paraplantarum TaxID=60520 RepID=UPI0020737E84|nr:hypothetical protein [Lactiplantibacillus paraplantarum]